MTFPAYLVRDTQPMPNVGAPGRLDVAYYVIRGSGHADAGGRFQYGADYDNGGWTREQALTRLREMTATSMVKHGHGANQVEWVELIPYVRDE